MNAVIETKQVPCYIYIKINCDTFPSCPWSKDDNIAPATGKEIYDFLMSDCFNAYPQEEDLKDLYNFPPENKEWELEHGHGGKKYIQIQSKEFKGNDICNRIVHKHKDKNFYQWYSAELKKKVLSDFNPITEKPGKILFQIPEINEGDHRLEGDRVIWYMGCCEKFGNIWLNEKEWKWGHGESSFNTIKEFIDELLKEELIYHSQYNNLMKEIKFASETFCLHYDIPRYLRHKKFGIPYEPDKNGRAECKAFNAAVNEYFEKEGCKVYSPNVNW